MKDIDWDAIETCPDAKLADGPRLSSIFDKVAVIGAKYCGDSAVEVPKLF